MRAHACLLLLAVAASIPSQDLGRPVVQPGLGQKLDDYMRRMEAFDYSGSILVEHKGQIVLAQGYGYANREKRTKNRPDTLFDIGSLAKQFTATQVLLLARQGKLSLSDPISKHLQGVPDALTGVTIQHLLTHTAGIGSTIGYSEVVRSREEVLKRILAAKPAFKPGESFAYSNEGYVLLANIVEIVSGKPFQDTLQEGIFRPAGLACTGFWGTGMPPAKPDQIAFGYNETTVDFDLTKAEKVNWADMGGGQVVSNLPDLYRWAKAVLQGSFLTDDERKQVLTPVKPLEKPIPGWFSSEYGYGWLIQTLPNGHKRIHHGGDSYGFGSEIAWYPDDQLLIVSLCNVRHDVFPDHIRADRVLPQIVLGEDHQEPPAISSKAADASWVGTYRLDDGGKLVIYRRGEQLMVGAHGQAAASLLDQAPKEQREKIEAQEKTSEESIPKLFARDYAFMEKLGAGKGFVDGLHDEIAGYGKSLGKPLGAKSLGTYQGGFVDFTSIWDLQFEKGHLPYKVQWNRGSIAATWVVSPPYAAQTPVHADQEGNLVGWNLATRRAFKIKRTGGKLEIEGPELKATARKA